MSEVTVAAPAKINLLLRAGSPQPDGYHPLLTVFQAVSLFERVTLRLADRTGVALSVSGRQSHLVPLNQTNLASRAVWAVANHLGLAPAVELHIDKAVPVAGGLAGGSADAAAALVAANRLWQAGLDGATLHRLAAGLGSDVNICLTGGTAIGRGRGERLEPLDPATGSALAGGSHGSPCTELQGPTFGSEGRSAQVDHQVVPEVRPQHAARAGVPCNPTTTLHWVLVARPSVGLSTPAMFAALDQARAGTVVGLPDQIPTDLVRALRRGDAAAIGHHLANDLQAPALAAQPVLGQTLTTALSAGALGAVVSGSGPTVAALAASAAHAADLAEAIARSDPKVEPLTVTAPVPGPLAGSAAA